MTSRCDKYNKSKKIKMIFIMVALMIGLTFLSVNAADPIEKNQIKSILFNKDATVLELKIQLTDEFVSENKNKNIYLFELMPYHSASRLYELSPVETVKVSKNEFSIKLDFDKTMDARLFAKYLIAEQIGDGSYEIVTAARYIDNPEAASSNTYAYPHFTTKKGLHIQMDTDAQELGVANTIIEVAVNEFILPESSQVAETYIFDNKNFYVNKTKLDQLDHKIKTYSEAGIQVFLNIVLTPYGDSTPEKLKCLYFDSAQNGAKYYAFNTTNQDAMTYLQGFLRFLASRYTSPEKEFGFAGSFIFGYEVNSNRSTNNMGAVSMDSYLNSYLVAFRIADTAMRSVYSNGKVYISIANNFTRSSNAEDIISDSNLDYSGKALLEAINTKITYSGNIPWNVAINPYASNKSNSEIWNDEAAWANDYDTPYITMKNIEVLCNFLKQASFQYNDRTRSILISEFGVSSGESETNSSEQAASIVYSYFKAQTEPMIDAVIYYRHVDSIAESGLSFGLWTSKYDMINTPFSKKTAYNVFKYMDTSKAIDHAKFALPLINNASDWESLIPGFKEAAVVRRKIYETIPTQEANVVKGLSKKTLYEFSESLHSFYPSDNANYIERRADPETGSTVLYGRMYSQYPGDYMGISCVPTEVINLKNVTYITFKVKVEAPEGVNAMNIMLRLYNNGSATAESAVYEAVGQITPGTWQDLTFKTEALTADYKDINGMKLWVKPYDGKQYDGGYGIWISEVTTYSSSSFGVLKFILWTLVVLILLVVLFFAYVFIRNAIHVRNVKKRRAMRQARAQKLREQEQRGKNNTQQINRPPQNRIPPPQNRNNNDKNNRSQ